MTKRSVALFALRLVAAAGLLLLVVHFGLPAVDSAGNRALYDRLASAWIAPRSFAWLCFGAAVLLLLLSFWVGALRFRTLLRSAGLRGETGALLRAYLIAGFFNLVLPGLILGDVYRLADARRDTGRGGAVFGLVVLERLLGFAALGAMALIALPLLPGELVSMPVRFGVATLALAILTLPVLFVGPTGEKLAEALAARIGAFWKRAEAPLRDAGRAARRSARQPGVVARTFLYSLVNQGLPVAAVFVLSLPLDSQVDWTWFAVIVPFVTLASLLPISLGGTGVREALFVALFGAVGMRAEVALVLSLSILAAALALGAVGLLLFALGRGNAAAEIAPLPGEAPTTTRSAP